MTDLVIKNARVVEQGVAILNDVSVNFGRGELVVILGPNGAGKTTLLKYALGYLTPSGGTATIDGIDARTIDAQSRALKVAYLPQTRPLAWPVSVNDTVALGRFAHGATLGRLNSVDQVAVQRALKDCALTDLQNRRTDTLSGGELARVHCARALAAEAPLLLADEPVVALDPRHQFLTMQIIRQSVDLGRGAVVILHDPALAARFADRLVWMLNGQIVSDGPVTETLSEARLAEVYGVASRVERCEQAMHVSIYGALQ